MPNEIKGTACERCENSIMPRDESWMGNWCFMCKQRPDKLPCRFFELMLPVGVEKEEKTWNAAGLGSGLRCGG